MTLILSGDNFGGCEKHSPGVWRSDCEECCTSKVPPTPEVIVTGHYDGMLDRMQMPEAREGMEKAFHATPEELGKAAVKQAEYCNGCRYGSHCLGIDPDCGCGCCEPVKILGNYIVNSRKQTKEI